MDEFLTFLYEEYFATLEGIRPLKNVNEFPSIEAFEIYEQRSIEKLARPQRARHRISEYMRTNYERKSISHEPNVTVVHRS